MCTPTTARQALNIISVDAYTQCAAHSKKLQDAIYTWSDCQGPDVLSQTLLCSSYAPSLHNPQLNTSGVHISGVKQGMEQHRALESPWRLRHLKRCMALILNPPLKHVCRLWLWLRLHRLELPCYIPLAVASRTISVGSAVSGSIRHTANWLRILELLKAWDSSSSTHA